MIFWERLKTTDLLPCYYLISWLTFIESTMEFCYIFLNSALVLKAVPLVTRENKPLAPRVHQTTHCLQNLELVTTYKALNGLASGYIANLIDRCPYDPVISCSLKVPSTNTVSFGDRAFSVAAPKLGSSLKNFKKTGP